MPGARVFPSQAMHAGSLSPAHRRSYWRLGRSGIEVRVVAVQNRSASPRRGAVCNGGGGSIFCAEGRIG